MPNPLDTLYDQLKGQYPDLVDRSEFIGKLSNEDELKKLHDAASKDIPGFVDFDNFKSKVGESLSTYEQDSDYKAQSAPAEQESAPTDITIPRREKGRHVPQETQNGGIDSETHVPAQPVQPVDTHVDAEPFDRETGDLDELDRRYQDKVKRLEGYGVANDLYVNEDEARKHNEAYSRLLDEAEQDRLVYNRRVKAAEEERAEQQRQLDLQSKDRKTRRSAEYGGYTNDQVRKEQERLKKERAYLEDPKSRRKADYSRRVMEYNADQTALSGEADKRNKRAENKRAMYDEVKKVAEDPDVQKRITGNDTVTYVLSGNNTYALQNYDTARERAKTMSDEELVEHCKTIAGQKYARGDNKDIYAPLAAAFMAYHNELMYRLGGDEPKSALEMRYDMIDKATESSPEGDNFMLTLRNYLDGTAGMGTANFENDQSERANIPQFAVVDEYNRLVAQKEDENMRKVEQISRYPQQEGVTDLNMAAAATNINYDAMLQQAFEKFGDENLKAYITAYALRNGISIDDAARRVNQSIWDETIGKTMDEYRPKSGFEFFVRRIFSDNMFSKLGQIGLRARNGTLGSNDPFMMSSMVLDEYAKDHPVWDTAAVVTNFAVLEGPIFSGYGKLAGGLVGAGERALIGAALKTTEKEAINKTVRALSQSLVYRLAKGVPTGGLVGFQYGTMSGAIDQAYYDGNVNFGKVIANGGHMTRDFAIMHGVGEVFGVTGDAILRRGQRAFRNGQGKFLNRLETASLDFLNNVAKTTANASIVTGLYAAIDKPALERENKKIEAENKKIEAENARLPEDKQKPLKPLNQIASVEDTFYSSLRMFAGLDAVGTLRRAWSIGVRGDYERNKHVHIHFDKFDREALEKAFGKNPNSLLRQIVFGNVDGIPAKWFEIDPEAEAAIYQELGRELTPAEKEAYATYGFTELRKVILNKDIPWATRAKIVSVITGRVVQEPPVAKGDFKAEMDSSGTQIKRIIVKSLDLEGNVIQITEFSGKEFEAARRLYESLNDRGWRNNAMLCGNLVIDAIEDKTYADTVDEMAREKGIAPDQFEQMVFGIKQKDITGEKVTYQERQLVDEFDKRHQEKQKAETELSGPNKLFEQVAREVFGAEWKQAKAIPLKSWGELTEAEKEFVNRYIDRMGALGVAERNKLMNANPDWARTAKEYEESVRRRMAEAERPAEAEPLPALEDEKVSVETPAEERVEPVPEVIELEEEPGKEQPTQSAGPQDTPAPVEERPAEPASPAKEKPATVEPEQPMTEEKPQQAGTIGFEPVEQPTERERFDAERKAKAATITDADIEANREALGIPEGTALTDETRQIYAEDLAEDLMRYERFKRGESDEKARFHDYWENKFNPKRPKLEKPVEKHEEPVEQEEPIEEEGTESDALIEQLDNLKGSSDLEKYRHALKVFAGDDEIMGILEDLEPRDITEWVSSFLGLDSGKGYSMLWESKKRNGNVIAKGFKEETGWSWNDAKGFAFMFDNKNGMSPRRVAEKIWENLPSGMKSQYSDVDVFDIMMDLFKSSSRKSDLTNYIRNNRLEQVRELLNRRRSDELAEIARYKERERRGEEEPVAEPVTPNEGSDEFAVREDDIAPFSLLSLNYRGVKVESGTVRTRARTRKQIGTIAKALGYKIRWVADKSYNAKIDTDEKVLYLNIRTDMPLEAVMGHEVTHDLRRSDPEAYETLKRYAKNLLGQAQWDSEVAGITEDYNREYERMGWEPIRADKAEEEVVCDTMGKLLHSRNGLRELAGSLDPGVAGKVYRLIKGITDTIKHALDEIGDVTDPVYREHNYSTMDSALQEFLEAVKQRAKKNIHRDPSGGYSVTDKADIESMTPRMEGESEAAYNERIAEIGADEKAFVDGDGQFSLKREDKMRDNSVKYFEEYHVRGNKDRKYGPLRRNSITRQALDKANEMIAEMRDYIAPWYDRETGGNRYLPEEVYGLSTIFDNASYGATLENTLICTRTLAYNDFCDSVKRKLGRPLTKRESFLASQMLYDIATDPQCLYCYVSLDRKAYDEYLLRYFDERDAVIERYNKMADKSAENIDALYKTFLDGRKDTYQMRSRFNSWLQLADHDSAIGRDKVALSSDRKNALAQESNEEAAVRWREISKQYNRLRGEEKKQFKQSKAYLDALHGYLATEQGQIKDACAYAQGASWAKKEAEYRSYTGELLRTTKRMLGGLASHYGLRFYSFSEYSPAFILENMQMIRDAALRGLKGFAYTKEIDFCKIFLPTGININCSTYGRRNAAGEIVMDERQGANWDEARALRDQYENMGIVFVATDDEMVRWAKEQPWIDVIIPFHIVKTGADIAEFYGWTNYTNVSADYDAQGRHKDIMPPEHNNSIEDYDRLIAERGLTRRFPQFYDGPGDQNYMKLINETRRKASDTPILTPVFNMEEAKKSFDRFVEKGGYWGGFYEVGADDVVRAVDEVAADIEAGKSAGEVEYGRQDIDFDAAMSNLEKTRRRINRNREHGNTPKTSFSLKRNEERTLMGVHNITPEKLRSALKLGGLANPSMAVIDTKVGGFDNFGEISLIPASYLIASRSGRNAGTWGADAYSPRFPETHRRLGKGGDKKMRSWINGLGMRKEMEFNTEEQFNDYYNGFNIRDNALVYPFLHEKGLSDQVDYYTHKNVDSRLEDDLREANGDQFVLLKRFDEDEEYKKKLTDIVIGDEVGKIHKKDGESFQEFRDRRREWAKQIRDGLTGEDGYINRNLADDLLYAQARAYRENGKFNESYTHTNAEKYIRDHGMQDEYQQYFEQKMQELGAETQVYAGSDSMGRSKFKPIDLESVSKQMKKQGRAGGEGGIFEDSPGAIRAKLLNPMKTLDQIRKEKGRIVGHDEFEKAREEYQDRLRDYADTYANGSIGALADILTSRDMAETARRYNKDLDAGDLYDLNEFKDYIKKLPTEYFETKFERPVGLEEFKKAVVPDNLPLDLYGALERAGLEIVEYPAGDREARQRVTLEAAEGDQDVLFSLKRRRNRDDYTDEDRADAAIIANTYLAQADALRQQIEADRQREHQLVEERNRLLAFDYPAADPADRPAIMDRINDLRSRINDLRNANYENNTKLRSMDYEYRVAKEILEQGAVTDEEAARFDAGQMTREEKVLEQLFKAAADSRADKKAKQKAIRGLVRELTAITDNFKAAMKARGIESQRKHYDKGTVDHIIRLAKAMMGTGYIDNMTSYEVKRLMGMINNAATRESIETQAGRIVDMMLDHQIRTLRNDFNKQLKVTGQKTNSSGVQVQAGLDQEGQVVMEAMRKSMQIIADSAGERYDSNGYLTEWGEFYEKALNDMGDEDPVKAEQARKIFEGVWLASKWYEDVRALEINGRILRSQMEDFKASNKPAKDADKDTKQRYADVLADYQEMLRQNKINIIEAYERMTSDVGMTQAESIRRAKEFADAQKQRVNEIQHNANSDLADVDDNTQVETPESRVFGANKNNVLARLLFASAGTYEKFMRFFGRMAPNGEGYLFKRFMTQYHHARQDYWKGRHSAFEEMDKKMAEVFGKKKMHWSDIYEMVRDHKKFPPITVSYWDGYRNGQPRLRVDELNQSEALYLYMINKMPDGRMKLRHMGITDDVVQQMAGQIDNKLITIADWLQGEFLPKMRVKYNETHKRVFGADMAAIEDYFPLRINKLSVASDMDITERDMNDNKPSTITGAIVKRRVNTLPIDLHTDAFDVALSHIDEMEHWSAYAEFNRDNNTLVNYKRFRTKVNNMRSLELGAGDVLWKNFTDAVAIAADAYHPRAGSRSGDHYSTRVAKFVSTAKIALRPYTALKQLLSIPAFWADSDPLEQMKATLNVADTWQWAIENLPGFAERWQSRQAGNIKLANYNDLSGLRRRKTMRKLQRAGMWANAAIDGLACAMGGKAVYETKLKRYRKMGYDEARAQEKALIDAAIAYNNSQQSSEGAYVSPLQVDRTWFANAFSVFRSASMGYTRRMNTSLRQLRNATFKPGYGAQSVEFLKKQMMRDGLTEEQATKWAHRIYRRANLKAAASVAIFGQILPFTWNLGANMFYLLFGDDDKEKEGILADSFRHSFFGPVEGLTGGNVISELGDIAADTAIGNIWGDGIWGDSEAYKALGYREFSTMPLSSDLRNLLKYFARDEVKAANEVVNILFQVATGVNPQTITDWATAILDFSRSDMERRDIAMFAMRLLSTPQSQLDKFYLDQMNITQEQADKMSVDDLIKRYATYKRWRETPLTGWMYSDEREKEVEEKFQKRYEEMLEERSVAEDGLRGAINDIKDLPRKRTMMQKLQKELTDSIEATDPELYKKALEGEKADDDEYVRHVTDKDVEQMAELQMKKKALRAARDRKVKADKDAEAGRITQEEYDAIYKECAHQWKLYNYLNNTLPKKLKEWKLKMEPDMQDKYTPEQVMDTIRSKTDKALRMRPEDMKMKKGDKKKVKKNKKK